MSTGSALGGCFVERCRAGGEGGHAIHPSRSLIKVLTATGDHASFCRYFKDASHLISHSRDGDAPSIDLRCHYTGNAGCAAVCESLLAFVPPVAQPPPSIFAVQLSLLAFPQCGLDAAAARSLFQLLTHERFAFTLRVLDVSDNPYLALEAGQLFLCALGYTLRSDEGAMAEGLADSRPDLTAQVGERGALAGADAPSPNALHLFMRQHVSRLQDLRLEGTNIPPHYARRIAALCQQNQQ